MRNQFRPATFASFCLEHVQDVSGFRPRIKILNIFAPPECRVAGPHPFFISHSKGLSYDDHPVALVFGPPSLNDAVIPGVLGF